MEEDMPMNEDDAFKMADEIVDVIENDLESSEDGLTKRERKIEVDKEAERIRKAKELKKQLRQRELGFLNYRWPAVVLILAGVLAIWTEFNTVWVQHEIVYGFNTFLEGFLFNGSIFFLFPIISGVILTVLGVFAYRNPKATYLSAVPAMLMAMAGAQVYFLVTAAVTADPSLDGQILATGTPFTMFIIALLGIMSYLIREKE
ncbi:MAG: hypothetical protein ACW97A_09995 [Candidatus Thorarchaeota archaeon]|jgi:hypothetical protein